VQRSNVTNIYYQCTPLSLFSNIYSSKLCHHAMASNKARRPVIAYSTPLISFVLYRFVDWA